MAVRSGCTRRTSDELMLRSSGGARTRVERDAFFGRAVRFDVSSQPHSTAL